MTICVHSYQQDDTFQYESISIPPQFKKVILALQNMYL